MSSSRHQNPVIAGPGGRAVLVAALAWSLAWKGASLWRAARNGSKPWFATLLLSNTLGVLDAIYVFGVDRRRVDEALAVITRATGRKIDARDRGMLLAKVQAKFQQSGSYIELLTKFTKDAIFIGIFYMLYQVVFISTGILQPLFSQSLGLQGEMVPIMFWLFAIVGVCIIAYLVESPLGRRKTGLIGFGGTTILIAILTFVPRDYSHVITIAYILLSLVSSLAGPLHFVYSPELFPTRIRATAEGWKQAVGRAAGIAVALLSPLVQFDTLMYIILAFSVLAFFNQYFLARETRGKRLEEISA